MFKPKSDKENTGHLREQVRHLQESLRKLQEGAKEPCCKAEGLAEGVVTALGKLVPGLGKLIESASQMPEFHQRLAAIDEEIKRKFKEQPLGRAAHGIAGSAGHRQIGIPPAVRRAGAGRPGATSTGKGKPFGQAGQAGKFRHSPRASKVHIDPEKPAQLPVDVFDEGRKIVVLAEAPGLKPEDIGVSLDGGALVISIQAPGRRSVQRVELPCEVTGQPETALANGIMSIQLRKATQK